MKRCVSTVVSEEVSVRVVSEEVCVRVLSEEYVCTCA